MREGVKIVIDSLVVVPVNKFKDLGVIITSDGRCDTEIKTRIGVAKDAFSKRKYCMRRNEHSGKEEEYQGFDFVCGVF